MVTDSHYWLKAVVLFPSNFSGFSIFSRDVRISSCLVPGTCCALAMPSTTSWTSSWGVNVGRWFGGDGGGIGVSGSGGDGGPDGGLDGGPPVSAPCGFLRGRGMAWTSGIIGMAGLCILLVCGERGSWMGLLCAGHLGSGGGALGAAGAVVLEGLAGLRQSWRGSGFWGAALGEAGSGI